MSHVLGLDLGLANAGAAQIHDDGSVFTWVKTTPTLPCIEGHRPCRAEPKHHTEATAIALRIREVARWAVELATTSTVLVVIEGPSLNSRFGMPHERAGVHWQVVGAFARHEIPVAIVSPSTAKAYMTGSGKADKDLMKRCVAATYPGHGLAGVTEHEADAVALAACGVDWCGWPGPYLDGRRGAGWLKKAQWPEREAVRA